MFISSGRQIL